MIAITTKRSLLFGLLLGLGLLALLLTHISLGKAWWVLARLDGHQLLLPLLATAGSLLLRPWRWQMIFLPGKRPEFWSCFSALAMGLMTNNFLPGRGGDLLRCFLLRREASLVEASMVLATLGLEKVLDGLALLVVVIFSFWFFTPPQWLKQLGLFSGLIFTGGLAVLLLLRYRETWFLRLIRLVLQSFRLKALNEKVSKLFAQFAEGLSILESLRQVARLIGLTILVWMCEAALIWGLASALQIPLSLPASAFVSAILGLGLMIPAAPGAIGTYEFFSIIALRIFGIGAESALALTLVLHAWSFLATTLLGLVGLWIGGIGFSELISSRVQQQSTTRMIKS